MAPTHGSFAHPLARRRLLALGAATLGAASLGPPAHAAAAWPDVIPLPDGFRPEGIAVGRGPTPPRLAR